MYYFRFATLTTNLQYPLLSCNRKGSLKANFYSALPNKLKGVYIYYTYLRGRRGQHMYKTTVVLKSHYLN